MHPDLTVRYRRLNLQARLRFGPPPTAAPDRAPASADPKTTHPIGSVPTTGLNGARS